MRVPRDKSSLSDGFQELLQTLRDFPWSATFDTLRERFAQDRLGVTAGSLTFTTTFALVPLVALALAVFTAFPMFGKLQSGLQTWLAESLVPEPIARQVVGYLTQFAGKASQLSLAGLVVLVVTGLALMLTIDKTLNQIWRVNKPRALAQRVLVYWGAITLGPLMVAISIGVASYAMSASKGWVTAVPGLWRAAFDVAQFGLVALGAAALYHFVPNTRVRWVHASVGGLFVAVALELAQRLLAFYLAKVPTYAAIYGTFATVPILLAWIFLAWLIVLFGAVVAAYLPSMLRGVKRRAGTPGWTFQLALEIMGELRGGTASAQVLARKLGVEALQLERPLQALATLGWIGELNEDERPWALLLAESKWPTQSVEPLVKELLIAHAPLAALAQAGLLSDAVVACQRPAQHAVV
jgi:membrane protein